MIALTHRPSPRMAECQLTFVDRMPIDFEVATRQHGAYCRMLESCGVEVCVLDLYSQLPDCAFVEDAAVVLDEVALLGRMGAASRQDEPAGIEPELRRHRVVHRAPAPAILEGGDVLRVGRTLLVGLSSRTNAAGTAALEKTAEPFGYKVRTVPVRRCLHLKTACTALPDGRLLVNPDWIATEPLDGFALLPVPASEPWGANVLCVGETVCAPVAHGATVEMIRRFGFDVRTVDLSEFAKAEAGVTCLSLLIN